MPITTLVGGDGKRTPSRHFEFFYLELTPRPLPNRASELFDVTKAHLVAVVVRVGPTCGTIVLAAAMVTIALPPFLPVDFTLP